MATGLRYADKVVIVTGGTRGIGEGIVREFVLQGARVVFCAPASEGERGKALQQELEDCRGPGEARFVVCDVCSETDIKTLVSVTMELYGRLDCLVNNAGGHPPEQRIDDVTAKEFRSLLDLNLVSCFLTSKFALTHLRKTKGNIINISSLVGITGQKYAVTYVATKGALTAMTKAMAIDESQYGVRVNSISPGNIWTPMWEKLASQTANPKATIQEGKNAQASALWENGQGTLGQYWFQLHTSRVVVKPESERPLMSMEEFARSLFLYRRLISYLGWERKS
ncbi:17-beta-hydroxysteroid dehydrogenase 14 isoform X1 [Varanus komodoensis]|uniref:17-beta-hydroxysteroid dehydrogenase 14 isoform X1 n=1 Tax=Varanus komodoensis TaxID=61221 RepID=UPI001CF7D98B|nr:17-beta-hydroxysteroid dehydrogenase 14 isoform X1 [Varanus komodoensis]